MVPPPVMISSDSPVLPMSPLPSSHFLSQPRSAASVRPAGTVDTATLNAHDFDVDNRTGFMPFDQPISRLTGEYEIWEELLDEAQEKRLQLGRRPDLSQEQRDDSEAWRVRVRSAPIISSESLNASEVHLRRAHCVLAWTMHFYIQSQPPPPAELAQSDIIIPAPIAVPLVAVSSQLQLPVVLTYSDDVLYNWRLKNPVVQPPTPPAAFGSDYLLPMSPGSAFFPRTPFSAGAVPQTPFSAAYFTPLSSPLPEEEDVEDANMPKLDNISCVTLFTGSKDEEEFYLSSAHCELAGVPALEAMRATMDELFVGDALSRKRIVRYLTALAGHIDVLAAQLLAVREGCEPEAFYHDIRPWFMGQDSSPTGRKWVFEGVAPEDQPTELSGPSAGQSSLVHALDVFLGVSDYSHGAGAGDRKVGPTFLDRMQTYMPRHHRAFLRHLAAAPRPLRALVDDWVDREPALAEAYNAAVGAMKRFRDGHMRIVALYIMGPARRERERLAALAEQAALTEGAADAVPEKKPLKGTGGTDLVQFLKGVRDRTAAAAVPLPQ